MAVMRRQLARVSPGAINGWMVATIGVTLLFVLAGSLAIWSYFEYTEQKNNVDGKVAVAVAEARREQLREDQERFAEQEANPKREFVGPDEYGRLTFQYSKQWSVYIANDARRSGSFEAYLNPVSVPPIDNNTRVALRVRIESQAYDSVLKTYENQVKKGDLKSSQVTINGVDGTRLDGNFSKELRGAAVLFKIRDKTLTIQTDSDTFKPAFENLITTIRFNG